MSDISPVVIAGCGLSIICVGLLVIGIFLIARFTGGTILIPLLAGVLSRGGGKDDDDDDDYEPARRAPTSQGRSSRIDPREKLDFDSAVERYRQSGKSSTAPDPSRSPSLRDPNPSDDRPSQGSIRRRRGELPTIYDDEGEGDGSFFDLL